MKTNETTVAKVAGSRLCVNDKVLYLGQIVGRVAYISGDWVGVRDSEGRVDEYPLGMVTRG